LEKLYKRFLIYKAILKGISPDILSRKFNISRNVVYRIKKEGFIRIKEKEKLVLDYFQKNPFSNVDEISKNLNFSKSFVYRTLKKYNIFTFKQPSKKILKILEFLIEKNDSENLKNLINYYNIDFDNEILNLKIENYPLEIKYIELSQKLNSGIDISHQLDSYLNELKEKELNFTYLKALIVKFDVLILKKQYKEIVEIFENLKKIDNIICLSLKAKFYNSYLNALSLKEEFEKGFTIQKKLKKIYNKLTKKERLNLERFISVFYYNYGNYKKAFELSKNHPLLRTLCLYQMGEYSKVINSNYNISGFEKFIYIYVISLSLLFIGESIKSIETFTKAYDIEEIKFEDIIELYYVFMTIYYKFIGDDNYIEFFKEIVKLIGNKMDKHFYAIVSKDISNLKNSPKDKLIKYYFNGRINKAVEISERYGIKTILNLLILFHPKNYIKLKKYKQLEEFLRFSKKPKIKLYLLRKRPYFKFLNKKFYLKDKGLSIIIIELLINSRIKLFKLSKKDVKFIKFKLKLPISIVSNEILLNADVYLDFLEAELCLKAGNIKKFKSLYKSTPFGLNYHYSDIIQRIINKFKKPPSGG